MRLILVFFLNLIFLLGANGQSEIELSEFGKLNYLPLNGTLELKNTFDFTIAGRVDKGTIKYQSTKHMFTQLDGDTSLFINEYGSIYLKKPTLNAGPLFIRGNGEITSSSPILSRRIPYNLFEPEGGDGDEIFYEVENGHGLVRPFSSEGVITAPLVSIENGYRILSLDVYYINQSDKDMEIAIVGEKRTGSLSSLTGATWFPLDEGGSFRSTAFQTSSIVHTNIRIDPSLLIQDTHSYILKIRCNDSSVQLIKEIQVNYIQN